MTLQALGKVIGGPEDGDEEKGEKDEGDAGEGGGAAQPRQRRPSASAAA